MESPARFLVVLRYMCIPQNQSKGVLGVFLSFLCSPKVCKSFLQLSHHFARMVRQPDSTLLSLTEILGVPKGYLGCFGSKSHRDRHYVSERWDKLKR